MRGAKAWSVAFVNSTVVGSFLSDLTWQLRSSSRVSSLHAVVAALSDGCLLDAAIAIGVACCCDAARDVMLLLILSSKGLVGFQCLTPAPRATTSLVHHVSLVQRQRMRSSSSTETSFNVYRILN
jgi:hypothetical protein